MAVVRRFSDDAREAMLDGIRGFGNDEEPWWDFSDIIDSSGDPYINEHLEYCGEVTSAYRRAVCEIKEKAEKKLYTIWAAEHEQDEMTAANLAGITGDAIAVRDAFAGLASTLVPHPLTGLPLLAGAPGGVTSCLDKAFSGIGDVKEKVSIYDGIGRYGGNQGGPEEHPKDFYELVRSYYPEMEDGEIDAFLQKYSDIGCGYMAMANTLFEQYLGREEEFLQTFGFPLYADTITSKDGNPDDFNFDTLVVDFYCASGHPGEVAFPGPRAGYWENYLREHGITVGVETISAKVKLSGLSELTGVSDLPELPELPELSSLIDPPFNILYDTPAADPFLMGLSKVTIRQLLNLPSHSVPSITLTPENFEDYASQGSIVMTIAPTRVVYENGEEAKYFKMSAHSVIVTGVTEDGLYTVSSWGDVYYIDPTYDYAYQQLEIVSYE